MTVAPQTIVLTPNKTRLCAVKLHIAKAGSAVGTCLLAVPQWRMLVGFRTESLQPVGLESPGVMIAP